MSITADSELFLARAFARALADMPAPPDVALGDVVVGGVLLLDDAVTDTVLVTAVLAQLGEALLLVGVPLCEGLMLLVTLTEDKTTCGFRVDSLPDTVWPDLTLELCGAIFDGLTLWLCPLFPNNDFV